MTVRLIHGLGELAPRYDGFIVDLWGVVHDGVTPYPEALDCLRALIAAGKRVLLLSNAPRRSDDVVRRISAIGVPQGIYHDVMSSGEEAWQHLHRRDDPFYAALGGACLHIGSERDLEMREGLAFDFVDHPDDADFILNTGPAGWEDRIADYDQTLYAAQVRGLPMVCANPDFVVIHNGRPALCAGALAQRYEELGGTVRWHGKPYRSVYDSCLERMNVADRRLLLAVGDSLRTDIAGANGAGIDAIVVAGGIHYEEFGCSEGQLPDPARIMKAAQAANAHPIAALDQLRW
jgi:HAD superfamily hydrolase (TIGR01459 family)